MTADLSAFVADLLAEFGITGVSAVTLLALVSVALYARRAARAGSAVAGVAGTAAHDLMVVSVVVAGLLLVGVLSADIVRAQDLAARLGELVFEHVDLREWSL